MIFETRLVLDYQKSIRLVSLLAGGRGEVSVPAATLLMDRSGPTI